MSVTVAEVMVPRVVTARSGESVASVRERMVEGGIHALPVVNEEDRPLGIVTSSDLVQDCAPDQAVSEVMTPKVYTVARDSDVRLAARLMRNRRLHHLLVVEGGKLVGMLSSFDLLRVVEEHRFERKS